MKKLRYLRHSDKMNLSSYSVIHRAGLDRIQKEITKVVPKGLTDIFHGMETRTVQTALGITANLTKTVKIHEPIIEVGTDLLFDEMYTDEVEELIEKEVDDLKAFEQVHGFAQMKEWIGLAARGVGIMFLAIKDDDSGLCCGHEPIISLAAKGFGQTREECLETLEFIDFVQTDDDIIKVESV